MKDTIQSVIGELESILRPLLETFERGPTAMLDLLADAGIANLNGQVDNRILDLLSPEGALLKVTSSLKDYLSNLDSASQTSGLQILSDLRSVFSELKDAIEIADQIFIQELDTDVQIRAGQLLIDYLFIRHLSIKRPGLLGLFFVAGALKHRPIHDQSGIAYLDYVALVDLFLKPDTWFRREFKWGIDESDLLFDEFAVRLKLLLEQFAVTTYFVASPSEPSDRSTSTLFIPLWTSREGNEIIETGVSLAEVSGNNNLKGIRAALYGTSGLSERESLGNNWEFRYSTSAATEIYVDFFPDEIQVGERGDRASTRMYFGRTEADNWMLFGREAGTRVELGALGIELATHLESGKTDVTADLITKGGRITISSGEGDASLKDLLPQNEWTINFETALRWSSRHGFSFRGSSGFEVVFPMHKTIGPITVGELKLALLFTAPNAFRIKATADLSVSLGPIILGLAGVGPIITAKMDRGGNLGLLDISATGLASPEAITLAIDLPAITGGGFLELDNHSYAGLLNLRLQEIDITALGLINTRLPGGQDGFSMLVCMNVQFLPAIQLSFGFTLDGIGGLLGVNRTMKIDTLRERVLAGTASDIMFPDNPIANASRLISDIQAVFPPQKKHFVIAPFVKLGWGTPKIIDAEIGVFLEVPFKGRVLLIGRLAMVLPGSGKALVRIHIDIFGDFNIAEKYLRLEGRLRDSNVVGLPLEGGFAFVLDWGAKPAFLFSVGGYHPRYKKPERFPDIPRLRTRIKYGKSVTLTCAYYQAITSNTFQIGFRASLVVKKGKFQVDANFGFNGLLQIDPLYFELDISMNVALRYRGRKLVGVSLAFLLSGPRPWKVQGRASVKVGFFKVKVRFSFEWPKRRQQVVPVFMSTDRLFEKLEYDLDQSQNWKARLPQGFRTSEILRPADELAKEGLVLHPGGFLEVRQSALPFDRVIQKYGTATAVDAPVFQLDNSITVGGVPVALDSVQYQKEFFARGQYTELRDADKLSTPDFEPMVAGMSFGEGDITGFDLGGDENFVFVDPTAFDTVLVNTPESKSDRPWALPPAAVQKRTLAYSTRSLVDLLTPVNRYRVSDFDRFPIDEPEYVIADVMEFKTLGPEALGRENRFTTYGEAQEYLQNNLGSQARGLHILSANALNDEDVENEEQEGAVFM